MLKEDGKKAADQRDREYHASHTARAMQILRDLDLAGKKLRPSDIKLCQEYSTEVFRHRNFAPWLLVYTAVSGGFKEGWIPDNFYGARVIPVIQGPYGRVSSLKSLSAALFNSRSFPDLGSRINGGFFDRDYHPLSFDEARTQFFERNDRIVFKADSSGQGKAIYFLDQRSFDRETIQRLGSGVFQRPITQHRLFDLFSDRAVAAIRITTVVEDSGEISPRAAYLCLATGSDIHVQSQSQVRVPLDIATGTLRDTGLMPNWLECSTHPTSGESFAGKKIPAFEQCLSTVISHHRRIPFVGSVGWDVIVDSDEEIQVLEWNGYHNGIGFSEATQGPCFEDLRWERFA